MSASRDGGEVGGQGHGTWPGRGSGGTDPAARAHRIKARLASLQASIDTYWGSAANPAAMDALYARFITEGDLVFDIGSHVGDRIAAFRRLGARVVALEPQPPCADVIAEIFAGDADVTLERQACGAEAGPITFRVNSANATVSTASAAFVDAAATADGWSDQVWDDIATVDCTTLDDLIARHGMPAFAKIDVEGFEADVLDGLSQALPALSFEFTTIQRDVAERCIARLSDLGRYRFNIALGESQALAMSDWCDGAVMAQHVRDLPHAANSGDIYAVRED